MRHFQKYMLYQLLVLMTLLSTSTATRGVSSTILDDRATIIDLSGIPAPYSFNKFCALSSGERCAVGGRGHVIYHSALGERREQVITTSDLQGVFFVSPTTGWVIGTKGKIFGTTDGGVNWKPQDSGVKETLNAITCISETDCWAVGDDGVVLRTQDGGQEWKSLNVGTSENLYALDFRNSEFGLIVGGNGIVLRTQDGGRTWGFCRLNLILFPDGPFAATADLEAVRVVSDKVAWVACSAGIAGTTDGGTTWSVMLEEQSFIGLVSEGTEKGWAIGRDRDNFCTVDAGQHWQRCKPGK